MKQYYGLLDGLRGYAVLFVLIHHWVFVPAVAYLGWGGIGVNIFFVISGFLITEILLNQHEEGRPRSQIIRQFYWKRLLRIFPIYYICCITLYMVGYYSDGALLLYNLSYTTNIYMYILGESIDKFSHFWSLCVEEQFYLFWPLLILATARNAKQVILLLILSAIGTRVLYFFLELPHYGQFNYRMTPACLDALGAGALLAYMKRTGEARLQKVLKLWFIPLSAAGLYVVDVYIFRSAFMEHVASRFLISVVAFYFVGWAIYERKGYAAILSPGWLKYIGKISYGVYLYHPFVADYLNEPVLNFLQGLDYGFFPPLRYNLYIFTVPIYTMATIAVSTVSYYLLEIHFLKLKNRFGKNRAAVIQR